MLDLTGMGKRVKISMGIPETGQGEVRTPISFEGASVEEIKLRMVCIGKNL